MGGVNKIGNDAPNTWRTLTYDEWYYLCYERPNYDKLFGVAQVNGVNGLILLPDSWICPSGVTFKSGIYEDEGEEYYDYAEQTFSASDWSKLEASGAVFFPAAGARDGSDFDTVHYVGYYWSANRYYNHAYNLYFDSDEASMDDFNRHLGESVRLVQD